MRPDASDIEYEKQRYIEAVIINIGAACSTVCLKSFPQKYGSAYYSVDPVVGTPEDSPFGGGTFEKFITDIRKGMDVFKNEHNNIYSSSNGLVVEKCSFVCASVQQEQGLVSQYLEQLGFEGTPWVYNLKNKTDVRFFIIPVPKFIKRLKEVDQTYEVPKFTSKYSKHLNDNNSLEGE